MTFYGTSSDVFMSKYIHFAESLRSFLLCLRRGNREVRKLAVTEHLLGSVHQLKHIYTLFNCAHLTDEETEAHIAELTSKGGGQDRVHPLPLPQWFTFHSTMNLLSGYERVSPAGRSSLFLLWKQEETEGPPLTADFCKIDVPACALFRLDFFLCLFSGF